VTQALLEVRDLHVAIDDQGRRIHPAQGVGFSLARGEALGLVGESGCGKTITLRAIMGILPSAANLVRGEIIFDGIDLAKLSHAKLRAIRGRSLSMIFQEPMAALNPVMRVGEQIAEAPRVHLGYKRSKAQARALELLKLVGIPDPARGFRAFPHELSGGMRQRVMIAIALSCNPKLILCDEPTTALDVTIQDQILRLLVRLGREFGLGLVFVTHDLPVVAQVCQRVAVMYAGQIVESGTVDEIFREPRHPYTLGLLRSVPRPDDSLPSLQAIKGSPPDLAAPPPGCRFHPRCAFVTEECRSGSFPLRTVGFGHSTACIHDAACLSAARADSVADNERRSS
jgi:oligopeptide/dipeptide ABC transporter ATP-binding protein